MGDTSKRDELLACACGKPGQQRRPLELLAADPALAMRDALVAAAVGDAASLQALLGADPALATRRGGPRRWDPLLYACFSRMGDDDAERAAGLARCADLLLEHGADPNAHHLWNPADTDSRLTALLGAAALAGNVALTRVLLRAGANPNDGESIFHAAEHERFDCLDLLLEHGGDVNQKAPSSETTPLHWVLDWAYKRRAFEWLLEHGADPNLRSGELQETALHAAVRRRRKDATALLLDRGADIDARTAGGKTAYAHARRRSFDEIADLLAERGADTRLTPADELAEALIHDDLDTAARIIADHPGLIEALGPEDARILPDLAGWSKVEALTLLLDSGADITARGLDGGTALHQAAWFGAPKSAELLIVRGAPIDIRGDSHDSTPLGWTCHGSRFSGGAAQRGEAYARIAEMLLQAGASLADPFRPEADPNGKWLFRDASEPVAEVLKRHGGRPFK
jgi:ankyrin repeat protein